jgi:Ca2+-binding EF-hand superfamily protein
VIPSTSGGPFALRKAFKYFDRDGSGDIDPDEFFAAMDWFGLQFTEDGVLGLFGLYDEDRGGSLGYYEFVENLIDGFGKSAPSNTVKNNLADMLVETQSLETVKTPTLVNIDQARRAFDYCDFNGSGRIELAELDGILKTLGLSTDSDLVNQAMLVLDKDCSGDVSFEEFWDWWQYAMNKSPKKSATRSGRSSPAPQSQSQASMRPPPSQSPNGRRSAMGFSGYGDAPKSPMMGANFAKSVRGSPGSTQRFGATMPLGGAAQQYGDVLSGSPTPSGIPKWTPPKPGAYIRQP